MRANEQATYASVDYAGVLPVRSTHASTTVVAVETTGR